jgi:hypothetical protein
MISLRWTGAQGRIYSFLRPRSHVGSGDRGQHHKPSQQPLKTVSRRNWKHSAGSYMPHEPGAHYHAFNHAGPRTSALPDKLARSSDAEAVRSTPNLAVGVGPEVPWWSRRLAMSLTTALGWPMADRIPEYDNQQLPPWPEAGKNLAVAQPCRSCVPEKCRSSGSEIPVAMGFRRPTRPRNRRPMHPQFDFSG